MSPSTVPPSLDAQPLPIGKGLVGSADSGLPPCDIVELHDETRHSIDDCRGGLRDEGFMCRSTRFESNSVQSALVTLRTLFTDFISERMLIVLGILSVTFFVGSLIAIPILIISLPVDYFDENRSRVWFRTQPPAIRMIVFVLKNLIGVVFLLAGIAMLVLPGQGILTILIGISLLDFPGKIKLERRLIGRPAVLRTINSIRAKFGKPSLVIPESSRKASG